MGDKVGDKIRDKVGLTSYGNIKQANVLSFRGGLRLEEAEEEGGIFCGWSGIVAVEIPKERLAGGAGFGVVLGAPDGPDRRIIALYLMRAGDEHFERRENLQAGAAVDCDRGPPPFAKQ